jgi:hypothetical protein
VLPYWLDRDRDSCELRDPCGVWSRCVDDDSCVYTVLSVNLDPRDPVAVTVYRGDFSRDELGTDGLGTPPEPSQHGFRICIPVIWTKHAELEVFDGHAWYKAFQFGH